MEFEKAAKLAEERWAALSWEERRRMFTAVYTDYLLTVQTKRSLLDHVRLLISLLKAK